MSSYPYPPPGQYPAPPPHGHPVGPATSTAKKGSGVTIAALIVALIGVGVILSFAFIAVCWVAFVIMFGGPPIVQLSGARQIYIVAIPVTGVFVVVGAVLAVIGIVRGARRTMAISAAILVGLTIIGLLAGIPLLGVEPCYSTVCA